MAKKHSVGHEMDHIVASLKGIATKAREDSHELHSTMKKILQELKCRPL